MKAETSKQDTAQEAMDAMHSVLEATNALSEFLKIAGQEKERDFADYISNQSLPISYEDQSKLLSSFDEEKKQTLRNILHMNNIRNNKHNALFDHSIQNI